MKVALASTSAIKVAACKKAFARYGDFELVTFKALSGVSEQPIDDETLTGAFNRINAVKQEIPDADLYVSIENGLFQEGGNYIDRAVVTLATRNGSPEVFYSDGVKFPAECVREAARRGFDQWTVGKVMAERGIVILHDDPHLDLSGKSRADYIDDTLNKALSKLSL